MPLTPNISIITVTYNAAKVVEATIKSIICQSYPHYEYIIIDGGSSDGTLGIINSYSSHINYFISEKDSGLYEAMNKGLKAASGQYVLFLNAGDTLFDEHTLEAVFLTHPSADIYYGDALYVTDAGEPLGLRSKVTPHKLPKDLSWLSLRHGMVVCHQAFIVRRSMAPDYNLSHPYSADIDYMISCLKKASTITHTGLIICSYLTGGFSKRNLYKSLLDRFSILSKHYGLFSTAKGHVWISLRAVIFNIRRQIKKTGL